MICNYNNLCKKPIFSKSLCLCCNHIILTHNNSILNIQKTFRGYKTRKKIKNIYIKLPSDIQGIILYYINLPIYYNNYYKKIRNIVNKKTKKLLYYDYTRDNKLSIDYINNCFYYVNKYCRIMNINEIKILFVICDNLNFIVNKYIYNYINYQQDISLWNIDVLTEIINFENNSFDKMIILYNRINHFNDIYNYYYSISQNNSIM